MEVRGARSSLSSCSTSGSEVSVHGLVAVPGGAGYGAGGSSLGMLRDLYEEMEPQITKSYRPHVVYVPPSKPPTAHLRLRAVLDKKKAKLKATHLMMQAVNEMKRKKEDAAIAKKREGDKSGKTSLENTPKDVTQSLPNLANNVS